MSDQQYQDFLDKASNYGAAEQTSAPKKTALEHITTESVPLALQGLAQDRVYTTEGDEPFRLVSLSCKVTGKTISKSNIAKATGISVEDVELTSVRDFDPRNEYTDVVQKVAEATCREQKDVQVFKTKSKGVRYDFWIVAASSDRESIIGYVTTAVES